MLVVLVGLTTYAVAWVSVWWVPAYLALMVLIFVIPQGHSRLERGSTPGEKSATSTSTDFDQDLQVNRADKGNDHFAAESTSSSIIGESTANTADLNPDSTGSGTTKPRRGRGRAQRLAKTATASAPDFASATWIRIGPGKFIRADANVPAVDQAQAEEHHRGGASAIGCASAGFTSAVGSYQRAGRASPSQPIGTHFRCGRKGRGIRRMHAGNGR